MSTRRQKRKATRRLAWWRYRKHAESFWNDMSEASEAAAIALEALLKERQALGLLEAFRPLMISPREEHTMLYLDHLELHKRFR